MSTKYGPNDHIPNSVLADRMMELVKVITCDRGRLHEEFTMRVPAEMDRDADLVLSEAAARLRSMGDHPADGEAG